MTLFEKTYTSWLKIDCGLWHTQIPSKSGPVSNATQYALTYNEIRNYFLFLCPKLLQWRMYKIKMSSDLKKRSWHNSTKTKTQYMKGNSERPPKIIQNEPFQLSMSAKFKQMFQTFLSTCHLWNCIWTILKYSII